MTRTAARRCAALVLTLAAGLTTTAVAAPAASADPVSHTITGLQTGGLQYAVFLVKDLGGGAYWNVTTNSLYVLQTGSAALVSAAQTGADLLITAADDGRGLLLLVNGVVLKRVEGVLPS